METTRRRRLRYRVADGAEFFGVLAGRLSACDQRTSTFIGGQIVSNAGCNCPGGPGATPNTASRVRKAGERNLLG